MRRTSRVEGLCDIVLMPLMFNYNAGSNLNVNFRAGAYAPTGDYEVGRLANTGKNFWTVEPTVGLMYLGVENGREASVFVELISTNGERGHPVPERHAVPCGWHPGAAFPAPGRTGRDRRQRLLVRPDLCGQRFGRDPR